VSITWCQWYISRLTLNKSQWKDCPSDYDAPIFNLVVCERFSIPPLEQEDAPTGVRPLPRSRKVRYLLFETAQRPSNCARRRRDSRASSPSRRDSDLEAFSHNPSDGRWVPQCRLVICLLSLYWTVANFREGECARALKGASQKRYTEIQQLSINLTVYELARMSLLRRGSVDV